MIPTNSVENYLREMHIERLLELSQIIPSAHI